MKNLKIYENNCKEDVLKNIQFEKRHIEYSIGKTLFAASDRGRRAFQDDSVLILEHPNDKNIKLIAVADGVGGCPDSNLASNYVMKRLIEWFEELQDFDPHKVKKDLSLMLEYALKGLKANIYAATTLSVAVVLENETIIANIGDSRIYTVKNNKLNQRTRDDSEVQNLLTEGVIMNKELARFHTASNVILAAIEFWPENYEIKYKTINNDYDKLLATTDGVSDCLSKKQLQNIIKNSKTEEIANNIVKNALILDSDLNDIIKELPNKYQKSIIELKEIFEEDYTKTIKSGKDNTTAAIYIRK